MGTVKYSGPVASFHCPTNAEIRSLKVHFSPKQLGEGDPSPENVREIVGWDGVVVEQSGENQSSITDYEFGVLGKNKLNPDWESGGINTSTGNAQTSSTSIRLKNKIDVIPNKTYVLSWSSTNRNIYRFAYKKDGSFSRYLGLQSVSGQTVTLNNDEYYIWIYQYDNTDEPENVQLELGSTATAYEPYDPNHTVYGGWVDLITGEVCEEWGSSKCSDLSWYRNTTTNTYYYYEATISNKARTKEVMCAKYKSHDVSRSNLQNYDLGYYYPSETYYHRIAIRDDTYNDLESFISDNTNTLIYYEVITPITYHLAPTQLQTFLGHNNVWSNADYVEVEYDLHETQNILARKQFIVANQPHIVKPAAAPLQNFVTDVAAPLKECKIHFEPVQDLHGYSNPWPAGGGKNIAKPYDNNYVSSTYISFDYSASTGTFHCSGNASASSSHSSPSASNAISNNATFTLPAGTYTLSIIDGDGTYIYAQCVSSTETVLAETTSHISFTTNEALTVFVRLKVAAGATVDNTVKIQLEAGSTATSYVPYENICPISGWTGCEIYHSGADTSNFITFPIDWSSAGTVYGGYVDLVTGEVWKMWGLYRLPRLTSSNCSIGSQYYIKSDAVDLYVIPGVADRQYPSQGAQGITYNPLCNQLEFKAKSIWSTKGYPNCWTLNATQIHFNISNDLLGITDYTQETTTTAKAKVIEYMNSMYDAGNYFEFSYPVTPVLLTTLTPTQLKTLRGTNNIWSNSNSNIELAYWSH